jgi:ABC transport system ATP-binding/permease protein
MSDRILRALMQLFAIIARPDSDAEDRRPVVENFLKQQLNKELVEKYLAVFDEFYEQYQARNNRKEKKRQTIAASSVRVLKICSEINAELAQKQKIIVLVRILEFINTEEVISDQEHEFASTVADAFNISQEEYSLIRDFIISGFEAIPQRAGLLVINDKDGFKHPLVKHIHIDGLHGEIKVLNVSSVNMQMFRTSGISELNLNGQLIPENKVNFLTPGTSIRHSRFKPIYYSAILSAYNVDRSKSRTVFETKDLVYKFKGGTIGLHYMNFKEESGNLVGIMGASGAGKSTLLNVLNGTYVPTEGSVMINGVDIHNDKEGKLNGLIGHVSQDDLLIEELTVYQNLYYNAKLCFDNYTEEQIVESVNTVLQNLGLFEKKDMVVGNPLNKKISGGQRKRLNIALELIREPSILFLDEPTSGLSSKDSENIMDLLKELSLKGKLVFVVIHQPSSDIFKTFDKLMILDTGGFFIYYGDPVDSIIYFKEQMRQADWSESECPTCGNVNPEQVFKIVEANVIDEYGNLTQTRKIAPEDWYEVYNKKQAEKLSIPEAGEDKLPEISFKIPNKVNQFRVFVIRDVLSKLTNTQYLAINLLEAPIIAVFLSYIIKYFNVDIANEFGYTISENSNLPVYLFLTVICAIFIGLTVSAEEIISDRRILKRESFLNLSRSSYLMSKVVILLGISAIQSFLFVFLGNSILEIQGMFFSFWLVAFSTWFFANMMGLNISDSFKTAVTIYILIPFLVIPQIIMSGIIVNFDKLNPNISNPKDIPIYGEAMISRWAYEAMAVRQFKDNSFQKLFYRYDRTMSQSDYKRNYWLRTLKNKLNSSLRILNAADRQETLATDLLVLRNEISMEQKRLPNIIVNGIDSLTPELATQELLERVDKYLDKLNTYYKNEYNKASHQKDLKINELQKTPEERAAFLMLKKRHHNENLSEFVRNSNELDRIVEYEGHLYQKIDPIFQDPEHNFLRAHFYSPTKPFFGRYMDTFWANIVVIWIMTLLLYFTLYFKVLKRILDYFEHISDKLFPEGK